MYQVSFENVEYFLSYEVRLKICDNAEEDDAKCITIAWLFFLRKTDELQIGWSEIDDFNSKMLKSNMSPK